MATIPTFEAYKALWDTPVPPPEQRRAWPCADCGTVMRPWPDHICASCSRPLCAACVAGTHRNDDYLCARCRHLDPPPY